MSDLLSALPARVTIALKPEDAAHLTSWAEIKGISLGEVLSEAVSVYLLSVRPALSALPPSKESA